MDCNQPVEVILHTTEEFQIFLMAHPSGDCKLSNVNLMIYDMIKLSKCCGLYNKYIDMAEQDQRRQEDLGKLPLTFNYRI